MKRFVGGLVLLLSFLHRANAMGADPETFRVVHLHVLQPNGQPAAHRDVELRGLDRRALGPIPFLSDTGEKPSDEVQKARQEGWLFTTDEHGDITAPIGDFAGWKDAGERPGWGTYILVVQPGPDDAGAASSRFWTYDSTDSKHLFWNGGEWGQPLPLPPEGLRLTMALQEGYTLYGKLVDDRDHRTPVPNVSIATWNDLGVDTHTGYGGEIFGHSVVTDAQGDFHISHLYHARLHLRMDALWMTTEQNGWQTQQEHSLEPPADMALRITCGVLLHPVFHYMGTVTDAQGRPVAGADVIAGISSEPTPSTYEDEHNFEHATTDKQGHFDLAASTPWCRFISTEDKAHGRVDFGDVQEQDASYPPGRYDMQFPETPNLR
jgi:hypothetical protein